MSADIIRGFTVCLKLFTWLPISLFVSYLKRCLGELNKDTLPPNGTLVTGGCSSTISSSSDETFTGSGIGVVVVVLLRILLRTRLKKVGREALGRNKRRLAPLAPSGVSVVTDTGAAGAMGTGRREFCWKFGVFSTKLIKIGDSSTTASANKLSMVSVALACASNCSTDWALPDEIKANTKIGQTRNRTACWEDN